MAMGETELRLFSHIYTDMRVPFTEISYDLSPLFTEPKAKKKRGEEKTDKAELYTPKHSAENKLELQCLSAPSLH